MSDDLYQKAVMRLAADAHGAGRLPGPKRTATLHNPMCGDRVTIDLAGGQVSHEARACLLCQAAASLICRETTGRSTADVAAVQHDLAAALRSEGAWPDQWPGLDAFRPVAGHPARHRCVLLPFEAYAKAAEAAEE